RLTNFNVEAQCTPSRASLMTGRYPVRSGNTSVPITTGMYGLTQWEHTIAEMLSEKGYATAMYGKWHLGHTEGRFPTDQGFDEWYGVPNSTDESYWAESQEFLDAAKEDLSPYMVPEYIYDGKKGSLPKKVKIYNLEERREIDKTLTQRAINFIERNSKSESPFFIYLPYTQTHMPVLPSLEFEGKSGNGKYADVLMQLDNYVGQILDKIEQLNLKENTIVIFTSDNGPEMIPGHHGWNGPWSGSYFTAKEGSLRVPFIIRWPNKVPAGKVSNEIVHQMDIYTTIAALTGADIPKDRIIDGVDHSDFFLGTSEKSAREGFVVYVGDYIFGVKWRNWKMLTKELEGGRGTGKIVEYGFPHFYNLYDDPQEAYPWTPDKGGVFWVRWPMAEILKEHSLSLQQELPIKAGTPDPYSPKK
ncbi:MAG: sulfatase-like hydrolase/transferase, partial [Flavobacteriaceae bacterium]